MSLHKCLLCLYSIHLPDPETTELGDLKIMVDTPGQARPCQIRVLLLTFPISVSGWLEFAPGWQERRPVFVDSKGFLAG